jgi:hypothetical protein
MTVVRRGVVAMALTFGLASGAGAALIDQGNGTVLDDSTNLLWLKDANYADTELDTAGRIAAIIANVSSVAGHTLVAGDFNAGAGRMTWWGAMAWAQDLTFAGSSDWRLPTVTDTGTPGCNSSFNNADCGYNVDPATGELARPMPASSRNPARWGSPRWRWRGSPSEAGDGVVGDSALRALRLFWGVQGGVPPAAVAGKGRALSKNLTSGARQAARDAHLDERDTACVYPGSSVNSSCGRAIPFIA